MASFSRPLVVSNRSQREYGCGHYKYIAAEWCDLYTQTHRRCALNVTYFEYW